MNDPSEGNIIIDLLLNLFAKNFVHLIGIIIYGILVLVLSVIGYQCFKAVIPLHVDEGLTEKENISVGIIIAGIIIGMSIIVAVTSYDPAPIVIPLPSSTNSGCSTTTTAGGGCGTKGKKKPHASGSNTKDSMVPGTAAIPTPSDKKQESTR